MKLATLKKRCPAWTWTAKRYGFGWNYIGTRGAKCVCVQPMSFLVGEDDFETGWMVDDGQKIESFAMWWLTRGGKDGGR